MITKRLVFCFFFKTVIFSLCSSLTVVYPRLPDPDFLETELFVSYPKTVRFTAIFRSFRYLENQKCPFKSNLPALILQSCCLFFSSRCFPIFSGSHSKLEYIIWWNDIKLKNEDYPVILFYHKQNHVISIFCYNITIPIFLE